MSCLGVLSLDLLVGYFLYLGDYLIKDLFRRGDTYIFVQIFSLLIGISIVMFNEAVDSFEMIPENANSSSDIGLESKSP